MNAQRALLDSLMGATRNDNLDSKRTIHWSDEAVCLYKLVSFCPYQLFEETRSNLGTCKRDHGEYLRRAYEQQALPREKRKCEFKLLSFLRDLINEVDSGIKREQEKLGFKKGPENSRDKEDLDKEETEVEQALSNPSLAFSNSQRDKLRLIEKDIKEFQDRMEILNSNNKKAEGDALIPQLESLVKEKAEIITRAKKQSEWVAPEGGSGRVCEVCGIVMDHNRTDYYEWEHFNGRIHQAWLKMRKVADELEIGLRSSDSVSNEAADKAASDEGKLEEQSDSFNQKDVIRKRSNSPQPSDGSRKELSSKDAKEALEVKRKEAVGKLRIIKRDFSWSSSGLSRSRSRGRRDVSSYERRGHSSTSRQRRDDSWDMRPRKITREPRDDRRRFALRRMENQKWQDNERRTVDRRRLDNSRRRQSQHRRREDLAHRGGDSWLRREDTGRQREDSRKKGLGSGELRRIGKDSRCRRPPDQRTHRHDEFRPRRGNSRDLGMRENSRQTGRPASCGRDSSFRQGNRVITLKHDERQDYWRRGHLKEKSRSRGSPAREEPLRSRREALEALDRVECSKNRKESKEDALERIKQALIRKVEGIAREKRNAVYGNRDGWKESCGRRENSRRRSRSRSRMRSRSRPSHHR